MLLEDQHAAFEVTSTEDWENVRLSPGSGCRFDEVAEGQFELVIERNPKLSLIYGAFVTYPDLKEYRTKAIWRKHPTKAILWCSEGRTDDIIVFSNGEKFNPLGMEQTIETYPLVSSALVVSTGHFQSCLLIELRDPPDSSSTGFQLPLVESVWSSVRSANEKCGNHGRIDKNFILFSTRDKPFLRAGKGSNQRRATIKLYAREIDEMSYQNSAQSQKSQSYFDFSTLDNAKKSLWDAFTAHLGYEAPRDDEDPFNHGFSSLHVTNLGRQLSAVADMPNDPSRIIYSNPSVELLAHALVGRDKSDGTNYSVESSYLRNERLQKILNDAKTPIPLNARLPQLKPSGELAIMLTGSTGSLGSYILNSLLKCDVVKKIYCLNRTEPEQTNRKQEAMHRVRGLATNFNRVEFICSNLAQERLGLPIQTLQTLLREVACIIHSAWTVDFNRTLQSFLDTHVKGLQHLIDFSLQSATQAHTSFISSISTVQNWNPGEGEREQQSDTKIPEEVIENLNASQSIGYAESKHLCEVLLKEACLLQTRARICRVGQIAGPVLHGQLGMWPKQEWLPSPVTSSFFLGMIPHDLGPLNIVDWLPVDIVAGAIAELAVAKAENTSLEKACNVYHLVNPHPTTWGTLLPAILESAPQERPLTFAPLSDWVNAVQESSDSSLTKTDFEKNPATKLITFFDSLRRRSLCPYHRLDVARSTKESRTLNNVQEISPSWMRLWLQKWKSQ